MTLVKFKAVGSSDVWVNPVLVASVQAVGSGTAILLAVTPGSGGSNIITVTDTPDSVVNALQAARPVNPNPPKSAPGT
jgi:hypothetical protein